MATKKKRTLIATTPHGTFTCNTVRQPTHVVVYRQPDPQTSVQIVDPQTSVQIVTASWHKTVALAHKAGQEVRGLAGWTVLGIYPVDGVGSPTGDSREPLVAIEMTPEEAQIALEALSALKQKTRWLADEATDGGPEAQATIEAWARGQIEAADRLRKRIEERKNAEKISNKSVD